MPQDGEISGWPSALRAFLLLYSYLLFYYLFIRTYLLPASSSSPWATRTWGGGGVFVIHPCSIAAAARTGWMLFTLCWRTRRLADA